jgi:RNA polymerase sigma-70 factor (ECF subfamily)
MDELENCIAAAAHTSDDELCGLLDDFLARLDERECRLFVGRYWYAYEVNRLAKAYGMTPNAVTKQLSRTREKLRAYLTERGYSV